jgi:hypothetical protein
VRVVGGNAEEGRLGDSGGGGRGELERGLAAAAEHRPFAAEPTAHRADRRGHCEHRRGERREDAASSGKPLQGLHCAHHRPPPRVRRPLRPRPRAGPGSSEGV